MVFWGLARRCPLACAFRRCAQHAQHIWFAYLTMQKAPYRRGFFLVVRAEYYCGG